MGGLSALLAVLFLGFGASASAAPVRAAYFYDYMAFDHVDSIAARGFDRAVIHHIADSLDVAGASRLRAFATRARALDVDIVPQWTLEAESRLAARGARRYAWGTGTIEDHVACPLDSAFWRSALIDRAEEMLAAEPTLTRLAIDLEIQSGSRTHYNAGPCRCAWCLFEYTRVPGGAGAGTKRAHWASMQAFQEARLTAILTSLLTTFAARHPGVELGVFDLDLDSFVHRALGRALARAHVPTADYCERSYSVGGKPLSLARARLRALGLASASVVGGIWLRRFSPGDLAGAIDSVLDRADGYFVFTTYSLWADPRSLAGPYVLAGHTTDYWRVLAEVNQTP